MSVDIIRAKRARRRDVHPIRAEVAQYQRVGSGRRCVWFDEHEGVVYGALGATDKARDGACGHVVLCGSR